MQAKAAATAAQTGSLATFLNGKLSTEPLEARPRRPRAYPAPALRILPRCACGARAQRADSAQPRNQAGFVPGLGKVSCQKLAAKGVGSTVQLMGEFLLKKRSREDFCKLLVEAGELRKQCVGLRHALRGRLLMHSAGARRDLEANETDEAVDTKAAQFCK